jgi:outer membrane protein assembly factor BamE (lipoprotein component of BamABCDE complex)
LPVPALRAATLLLLLPLLGGCGFLEAQSQVRGNPVDPDELKQMVVGTSTEKDAVALLGSPTARATFDDNTWLYISEVTRPRIARKPGELKQNVVTLSFNQAGVLQHVQRLDMADSQPVTIVSRTTPSPGSEASFLQQLFGNVGRYNPLPGLSQGVTLGGSNATVGSTNGNGSTY